MFVLCESYKPGWRVFFSQEMPSEVHWELKARSVWKGYDKIREYDGLMCLGYEFKTLADALEAIRVCGSMLGM